MGPRTSCLMSGNARTNTPYQARIWSVPCSSAPGAAICAVGLYNEPIGSRLWVSTASRQCFRICALFSVSCISSILEYCSETSACQLVQAVERVVHRNPPHAREPRFGSQFTQLRLVQSECAQALAVARQRQRETQEHAAALEQCANRALVLLRLVRAVDLQTEIRSVWLERVVNSAQHATRIDRIVDDVECGDHFVAPVQCL